MNKLFVIILILGFWFIFPIPFALMGMSGADSETIKNMASEIESISEPVIPMFEDTQNNTFLEKAAFAVYSFFAGIFNIIGFVFKILWVYMKILTIGLPETPLYINMFLIFLKVISGITIYLLLRGD